MNADDERSTGVKTCVVLCILLMIYGFAMLYLAYFATDDPAWAFRSQRESPEEPPWGFWIEAFRLLFFVPLALYALWTGFARPLSILLAVSDRSTWGSGVTFARLALLSVAVLCGGYHAHRCLDHRADSLASNNVTYGHQKNVYDQAEFAGGWTSLETQYGSARRSLTYYSGYAIVFFAVLVPLVLVVPAYSFFSEDLDIAREASESLKRSMIPRGASALAAQIDEVRGQFQEFRQTLTRLTERHVRLIVAIGAAVAFDQYFGALAMSSEAQTDVLRGHGMILGANVLLIAAASYFYYGGWRRVDRFLLDAGQADGLSATQFGPSAFVKNLLTYNHNAWVMLSLLASPLLASPWREQLAWFFKLVS